MNTLNYFLLSCDSNNTGAWKKETNFIYDVCFTTNWENIVTGEYMSLYKDRLRLHKFFSGTSKAVSNELTVLIDLAIETMC